MWLGSPPSEFRPVGSPTATDLHSISFQRTDFNTRLENNVVVPLGVLTSDLTRRLVINAVHECEIRDDVHHDAPEDVKSPWFALSLGIDNQHPFYARTAPGFHGVLANPARFRTNLPSFFREEAADLQRQLIDEEAEETEGKASDSERFDAWKAAKGEVLPGDDDGPGYPRTEEELADYLAAPIIESKHF